MRDMWEYIELPGALAMAAPAVRMVCVFVWADRQADGTWAEPDYEFHPVLAIVAKQPHRYTRERREKPRDRNLSPVYAEMREEGWWYSDFQDVEYEPLIYDAQYDGIYEAKETIGDVMNGRYKVAICPWDAAEDETRLAPLVEKIRRDVREHAAKTEAPSHA